MKHDVDEEGIVYGKEFQPSPLLPPPPPPVPTPSPVCVGTGRPDADGSTAVVPFFLGAMATKVIKNWRADH